MIYYGERLGKEKTRNDVSTSPRAWKWSLSLGRIREAEVHELRDLEMQTMETRRYGELDQS